MPTIAQVSLASIASKLWEPPTSSSHLAGTLYMIFSFVHSHYNGALYQTPLPKPWPMQTIYFRSAAPKPASNNKPTLSPPLHRSSNWT